jgi:hypothetical protein
MRRLFHCDGKVFAECLNKVRSEDGAEVFYEFYRGTDLVERRPATHSEKVRLHKFVNEQIISLWSYPITRMHKLLAAMAVAIYAENDKCPDEIKRQFLSSENEFDPCEFERNLNRAKQFVAQHKPGNNFADILWAIIPHRNVGNWRVLRCGFCKTWLLFGYEIDGTRITAAKRFCSDLCRVDAARYRSSHQTVVTQVKLLTNPPA